MKMKKILFAILLCGVMALGLAGCSNLVSDSKKELEDAKNGFMYVIDEEPFLKNPTGKPIIINYFYHEKIRRLSKNK
jgi:uncharacterized lipoprotein YehR (DUF1307 family)